MEGWEPRGVLRELCLRAVCVVVKVAGVAWAGMWRAKKGAERRRKCDLRVFFVAKMSLKSVHMRRCAPLKSERTRPRPTTKS